MKTSFKPRAGAAFAAVAVLAVSGAVAASAATASTDLGAHPVFLVRSDSTVDASIAASAAARAGAPLLYTPPQRLDTNVSTYLADLKPTTIVIVGGTGGITSSIEKGLTGQGYHVVRAGGADRSGTALALANLVKDIPTTGPAGPAGATGATGPAGPAGAKGDTGLQGAPGIGFPGPMGPMGPTGPIGLTGAAGATGLTGAAGPAGAKGDQGDVGPAGPQGPKGDTGATGAAGADGQDGATGAQGPAGPAGPAGGVPSVYSSSTPTAGTAGTYFPLVQVRCPAGSVATGGGVQVTNPAANDDLVNQSTPLIEGGIAVGWEGRTSNSSTANNPTVYVLCVPNPV